MDQAKVAWLRKLGVKALPERPQAGTEVSFDEDEGSNTVVNLGGASAPSVASPPVSAPRPSPQPSPGPGRRPPQQAPRAPPAHDKPKGKPPLLMPGAKGHDGWVAHLQKSLAASLKITLKDDGIFGKATEDAVKKFQQAHGLKVDGKVGPATWGPLEGAGGAKPADPATGPNGGAPASPDGATPKAAFDEGPNSCFWNQDGSLTVVVQAQGGLDLTGASMSIDVGVSTDVQVSFEAKLGVPARSDKAKGLALYEAIMPEVLAQFTRNGALVDLQACEVEAILAYEGGQASWKGRIVGAPGGLSGNTGPTSAGTSAPANGGPANGENDAPKVDAPASPAATNGAQGKASFDDSGSPCTYDANVDSLSVVVDAEGGLDLAGVSMTIELLGPRGSLQDIECRLGAPVRQDKAKGTATYRGTLPGVLANIASKGKSVKLDECDVEAIVTYGSDKVRWLGKIKG